MPSQEEIRQRYEENLDRANWPEARYEWDLLFGRDPQGKNPSDQVDGRDPPGVNPFDQVDDKLDRLEWLVRRGDFNEASPAVQWIRDKTPGGYGVVELNKYATVIDPIARLKDELDACDSKGDYARCLAIIEKLEKDKWQVKGVNRARVATLLQISRVAEAVRTKEFPQACARMQEIKPAQVKAERVCQELWVSTAFQLLEGLMEIRSVDPALGIMDLIEDGGWGLDAEQRSAVMLSRRACVCMQINTALANEKLDEALSAAKEAFEKHEDALSELWPSLPPVLAAITAYWGQIVEAKRLEEECQFEKAVHLLLDVPESLEPCRPEIYASRMDRLQSLAKAKRETMDEIDAARAKCEKARKNRRYWYALGLAKNVARLIQRAGRLEPRRLHPNELKRLSSELKEWRARVRKRAILALFTGEALLVWVVRRLRG